MVENPVISSCSKWFGGRFNPEVRDIDYRLTAPIATELCPRTQGYRIDEELSMNDKGWRQTGFFHLNRSR